MTNKPRIKKLSPERYPYGELYFPSVLVQGLWFRDCGFKPGDIVEFTSPRRRTLVMKVYKTVEELQEERRKWEEAIRLNKRKRTKSLAVEVLQS